MSTFTQSREAAPRPDTTSERHEQDELLDLAAAFGSYATTLSQNDIQRLQDAKFDEPDLYGYFKDLIKANAGAYLDENPEEAEKIIALFKGGEAATSRPEHQEGEPHPSDRPDDFEDFDYDDILEQVENENNLAPTRNEAKRRLGITVVRGAGTYNNIAGTFGSIRDAFSSRLSRRRDEKMSTMTPEERTEYRKKLEKRRRMTARLGIGAILIATAAAAGYKLKYGFETGVKNTSLDLPHPNDRGDDSAYSLNEEREARTFRAREEASNARYEEIFGQYNDSDSSFYDYANKDFRGDFGPGLVGSEKDGTMGPGFDDWMSRNKHEPNGLANLISGLKLDGHGDSIDNRNSLADILNANRGEHLKYDEMVQNALKDSNQFKVETIDITTSYDTTYMVDYNGDPVIATQENVNHGGTAFKITNAKTGEVTYWRKDCGGYQQIWLNEEVQYAPQPQQQVQYQPQGGGHTEQQATPRTPSRPRTVTEPEPQPTPPQPPQPPQPQPQPPQPQPGPDKGNAYQQDPHVVPVGPGREQTVPDPVESDTSTTPRAGIDQDSIDENHSSAPDDETGGSAPGAEAPSADSPSPSENQNDNSTQNSSVTGP